MDGIKTGDELLRAAIADLSKLTLTGPINWSLANGAINKINAVAEKIKADREAKEKAFEQSIEDAKKNRERLAQEAKDRGEELIGGEVIRITADGQTIREA